MLRGLLVGTPCGFHSRTGQPLQPHPVSSPRLSPPSAHSQASPVRSLSCWHHPAHLASPLPGLVLTSLGGHCCLPGTPSAHVRPTSTCTAPGGVHLPFQRVKSSRELDEQGSGPEPMLGVFRGPQQPPSVRSTGKTGPEVQMVASVAPTKGAWSQESRREPVPLWWAELRWPQDSRPGGHPC